MTRSIVKAVIGLNSIEKNSLVEPFNVKRKTVAMNPTISSIGKIRKGLIFFNARKAKTKCVAKAIGKPKNASNKTSLIETIGAIIE